MKSENEKLREMMLNLSRAENKAVAEESNGHLRDEDFIRLIEAGETAETGEPLKTNGKAVAGVDSSGELAALRRHLVGCDSCLTQFRDFYAFFAAPAHGEMVAGKDEITAGWRGFPLPISAEKQKPGWWSRLFSAERKPVYVSAFGWGLAAILLILTGISFIALQQATSEKNQLVSQLENQKQTSEERLKTIEQTGQNSELAAREKTRLEEEKAELQKRVATLQTEIEIAKQKQAKEAIAPPKNTGPPPTRETVDNSLVAVNTPIYDVFPSDSAVRGNGDASSNKLVVPNVAHNVVVILNTAGRADFPNYRAELVGTGGKTIWRGAGLKKDNQGNFTITLSRSLLKTGNYRLRLFSGTQTVAEYQIRMEIK